MVIDKTPTNGPDAAGNRTIKITLIDPDKRYTQEREVLNLLKQFAPTLSNVYGDDKTSLTLTMIVVRGRDTIVSAEVGPERVQQIVKEWDDRK